MAADTFTNLDGTTLSAHDPKWVNSAGVGDSMVIQSNAVQLGSVYSASNFRYENSQPQIQASQIFFRPGDWSDGIREVFCNGNDANDSYKVRVSATDWSLYKDGSVAFGRFQIAHGLAGVAASGLTVRVAQEASGIIRVSLALGNNTPVSVYSNSDPSAKISGYPGFRIDKGASARDQYAADNWTDATAAQVPYVRERLISKTGTAVASESGITMLVWRSSAGPTGAPDQVLTGVTTDASGNTNVAITPGSLAVGDKVWVMLHKAGTPDRATARRITPVWV